MLSTHSTEGSPSFPKTNPREAELLLEVTQQVTGLSQDLNRSHSPKPGITDEVVTRRQTEQQEHQVRQVQRSEAARRANPTSAPQPLQKDGTSIRSISHSSRS